MNHEVSALKKKKLKKIIRKNWLQSLSLSYAFLLFYCTKLVQSLPFSFSKADMDIQGQLP